jgi:hypothetical protein
LAASPDPLKEPLHNISFGNRYINSVMRPPHARGPSRGPQVEKTIAYSLYNAELYIAVNQLQRSGWVDYGSLFASDWNMLEHVPDLRTTYYVLRTTYYVLRTTYYQRRDAGILGYLPHSWPNLPQEALLELPSWGRLDRTRGRNQQSTARELDPR